MDLEAELTRQYALLAKLDAQILKRADSAHVESFSATGNSMTYLSLNDLDTAKGKVLQRISQLEAIKAGKKPSIFSKSIRM